MPKIKISIVGGCHTVGWGVGVENSFIALFLSHRSCGIESSVLQPFFLDRPKRLSDFIEKTKPDVLIFQPAHFETGFSLLELWQRKRGKRIMSTSESMVKLLPDSEQDKSIVVGLRDAFRESLKMSLLRLLRYSLFELENLEYGIRRSCDIILSVANLKLVVLRPFPSMSRCITAYRDALWQRIYSMYKNQRNVMLLDTHKCLADGAGKPLAEYYYDHIHLNKKGHRVLAEWMRLVASQWCGFNE